MSQFDTIIDRSGTGSEKWDHYASQDMVPMWVADMDFAAPKEITSALRDRIEHGVFGYTNPPDELNDLIVQRMLTRYQWTIDSESIVWIPGVVTALNVSTKVIGGDALCLTPIYPPFYSAPKQAGHSFIGVDLVEESGVWSLDMEALKSALTPETKGFLLCSPHNPSGRMWTEKELQQLAGFCKEHDLLMCSDEIHCDLIIDEQRKHIPIASLGTDISDRTITIMAPSKTWNIPGLGCSFVIIQDTSLRHRFKKAMAGIVPWVNALGFTAAHAAYKYGEPWLQELRTYLRENEARVREVIRAIPGLRMLPVEATYLGWIDCGVYLDETNQEKPWDICEKHGLAVSPGHIFGNDRYIRLNFGCSRPLLEKGLKRLQIAFSRE